MEESILYDLLDSELLKKWTDTIEKTERETWFFTREKNALTELDAELNEKSRKLLKSYSSAIENKMEYIFYNLKIKILNFGIKIGMDLQKAFAEYES